MNNYPLLSLVASFGKPVILSTGMNSVESVGKAVAILRSKGVPFALLHCTNVYPTPPELVRLGAIPELGAAFPDAVLGLSDHSLSPYPCLGAVALGGAEEESVGAANAHPNAASLAALLPLNPASAQRSDLPPIPRAPTATEHPSHPTPLLTHRTPNAAQPPSWSATSPTATPGPAPTSSAPWTPRSSR